MHGLEIKLARIKAGLKQSELAEAVFRHQTMISKYERGKSEPDEATVQAIREVTGANLTSG